MPLSFPQPGGLTAAEIAALMAEIYSDSQIRVYTPTDIAMGATTAHTGSGSGTFPAMDDFRVNSGATLSSIGKISFLLGRRMSGGAISNAIDWAKDVDFMLQIPTNQIGGATNWNARYFVDDVSGVTLTSRGWLLDFPRNSATFNFSTRGGAGITTTAVTKPGTNRIPRYIIRHVGGVRTELINNGVVLATHTTNVPTDARTARFQMVADNSGTTNLAQAQFMQLVVASLGE